MEKIFITGSDILNRDCCNEENIEMNGSLFDLKHGIIPACDVETLDELKILVRETSDIVGVVGYKIGCILALNHGISKVVATIREFSNLPIIYDHQKASTDIPQMGEKFAEIFVNNDIQSVILFPQSGPKTEEAFISGLLNRGLVPMVGGEMTHPMYLSEDGGFIINDGPKEMYEVAAKIGVDFFILPGNKPNTIRKYHELIKSICDSPKYCMPGIGSQGGDIEKAFEALDNAQAYAIIGSSIYKAKDIKKSAKEFCDVALSFG